MPRRNGDGCWTLLGWLLLIGIVAAYWRWIAAIAVIVVVAYCGAAWLVRRLEQKWQDTTKQQIEGAPLGTLTGGQPPMSGQSSGITRVVSTRGRVTYEIDLWHDELGKHRTIKGEEPEFVKLQARGQLQTWNDQWLRKQEAECRRQQREDKERDQEAQKQKAACRTREAEQVFHSLASTLANSLGLNSAIDWERLKHRFDFPISRPTQEADRPQPRYSDAHYRPRLGLLDRLIRNRREAKESTEYARFEADLAHWEKQRKELEKAYQQAVRAWEAERDAFLQGQARQNAAIDIQREEYVAASSKAILAYCAMVLTNSQYPDCIQREWDLDYNPDNKLLLIDYRLPALEDLPTLREVKYVVTRDEFSEKHVTDAQTQKLYDDLVYQIVLRTVHELFQADEIKALDAIVLNGYVETIDKGSGKEITPCILSLHANRHTFSEIALANVDPKACFRQLNGVGSSKLHSMAPVAPIMQMDREDKRFITGQQVAHELDDTYNLAAMPWDEFEHLIRELFEMEFAVSGGEVKITQASRDRGVDAVAFDPDPIRGGKIIIQAKRYTNTVGVSAVRDLYGTVLNEGANKGILVTTSDYGPDAYEFAQGKPLTLLNGGNLLHLLAKHGHKAKIDLRKARELAASADRDAGGSVG